MTWKQCFSKLIFYHFNSVKTYRYSVKSDKNKTVIGYLEYKVKSDKNKTVIDRIEYKEHKQETKIIRHQMDTFLRYWPFCPGDSPITSGAELLTFSLIWVWINCWVNSREAADLRRHPAHYDVIVAICQAVLTAYSLFMEENISACLKNWISCCY